MDDATIIEGDVGFTGMSSRLNPATLPEGMCQWVENMRLDRGVAQTRKGAKRLGDSIAAGQQPIVLPFVLDTNAIIETFYEGGILASGTFSSPNYFDANEYIVLCGPKSAFLWRQGEPIEEILYPANGTAADEILSPTDSASCVQAFNRFYILREADQTLPGWGWQYTTPLGISVSGTTATANILSHGYVAGQRVRIENGASAAFAGHEFDILTTTTDAFTFTVPAGTSPDPSAGISVRRVKAPLWWDGSTTEFTKATGGVPAAGASFKTLRSVPWATYIGNRLWIPDGRDTIAVSDVLDPDTYDPFFQTFRANQGSNDYLVGVHPWVEGQALVFMRNSIWIAALKQDFNGTTWDVDSAVSNLTLLTDEIGCVARRSIVTAGQYVFFLSDAGVYRLDTQLDLKLRANTQPLSDPIADQMEEINSTYANLAVGKWWNNRYHLACPIGEDATENNTLFLFNALNQQWESRDTYSINLNELLISRYDSERRLFAASRSGTLFLLDEQEWGDDLPYITADYEFVPAYGYLLTRRYSFGSLNSKRLLRAKATVFAPPEGTCELHALTTDYDQNFTVANIYNNTSKNEDYTVKAPLRCRATHLDMEFTTSYGRPTLRQISAEAARSAMDRTETRSLN